MVDITPLVKKGRQIIQGYTNGTFRISGETYSGAVMVHPDRTEEWSHAPDTMNNITTESFAPLFEDAHNIDVVLLGCGESIAFLPHDVRAALKDKGLNIETMDTGAACRTYNVLIAEDRRVVAALLPSPNN